MFEAADSKIESALQLGHLLRYSQPNEMIQMIQRPIADLSLKPYTSLS